MIKKVLEMNFTDIGDKKFSLRVDNAKDDIEELDVRSLGDFIISEKIFSGSVGELKILKDAYIRSTEIKNIL